MPDSVKLCFIADTHYYSPSLGTEGRAYGLRSGSDQKCLGESGAIIDAAFAKIAAGDADAVMIAGDLSNDGERVSHEEFREKLYKLKESKPVYVITATHDWCCDGHSRRYAGDSVYYDVDVLKPSELRDFYRDFGPDEALSRFSTHLGTVSYTVDIGSNVRLLALNDDQSGKGGAGFSEEHFRWIERRIAEAGKDGKVLIGMEHHLLLPHINKLVCPGSTCVKDREYVSTRLADAGLKYMVVGHSHIQDVMTFTTEKGNTLTEINVGSLVGYPAPIVNVTVTGEDVTAELEFLDSFELNGESVDAGEYLKRHLWDYLDRPISGAAYESKKEMTDRFNALGLPGESLSRFRPVLGPVLKFIAEADVGKAYPILNAVTLGKVIDKADAEAMKDTKLIDIVHEIMCDLFDGSKERHEPGEPFTGLVLSALSIPSKLAPNVKVMKNIEETGRRLILGNPLGKTKFTLK